MALQPKMESDPDKFEMTENVPVIQQEMTERQQMAYLLQLTAPAPAPPQRGVERPTAQKVQRRPKKVAPALEEQQTGVVRRRGQEAKGW